MRPEPLEEVSEPQVRAATVGYVAAAGAPLLAVPSLGSGDPIDDTSVHFLLEMALLSPDEEEQLRRAERRKLTREKEEKEGKEEAREGEAEGGGGGDDCAPDQGALACQRRRKKRKKKKLPRGGSSCARARRRHRQWHVPGWFSCFGASHAVFPSIVGRPERPSLLVGMHICCSGSADYDAPRVMFPSGVARPRRGGFSAVAVHQGRRHFLRDHGDSQLRVDTVVDAPILQVVQISCRGTEAFLRGPDCAADHRDSPVAPGHGGQCPSYAGLQVVKIPVVAQRQFPMVFQTVDIRQLRHGDRRPCCAGRAGRSHPC